MILVQRGRRGYREGKSAEELAEGLERVVGVGSRSGVPGVGEQWLPEATYGSR